MLDNRFSVAMDTNLHRPPAVSPYQGLGGVAGGVKVSPGQQDAARLNGWSYSGGVQESGAAAMGHPSQCHYAPYLGPASSGPAAVMGGKACYTATYSSAATDFLSSQSSCGAAAQLGAFNPAASALSGMSSAASRNFPYGVYGDVYQPHQGAGSAGLLSDFSGFSGLPRYDAEPTVPFLNHELLSSSAGTSFLIFLPFFNTTRYRVNFILVPY